MAVSEQDQIKTVVRRINGVADLSESQVEERVREAFRQWSDASVREFVPIFVERRLRAELRVDHTGAPAPDRRQTAPPV